MKFFLWEDIRLNKGQLSLFLLIFQSIGIRFFQGLGTTLLLSIIVLNYKNLKLLLDPKLLSFITLIIFVCLIQEVEIKTIVLYILMIMASVCVIGRYLKMRNSFVQDFKGVANFFCLYGTFTSILLVVIPQFFTTISFSGRSNYLSFYNILFNSNTALFSGWYRMSSLAWEPGCFQLLSSLYLLISIKEKSNIKKIIWLIFIQILTGSSMGYINLIIIAVFFLIESRKSVGLTAAIVAVSIALYPILQSNLYEKIEGSGSGSSTIRLRDFIVGIEKLKQNPIIGFPVAKLYEDAEAKAIEDRIWANSGNYSKVDDLGYFAGGYTNGLLGLVLNWGIPIALWMLYMFYKAPIIRVSSKSFTITFICVFLLTTISEPITFTPLFFIFPISFFYSEYFVKKRERIRYYKMRNRLSKEAQVSLKSI